MYKLLLYVFQFLPATVRKKITKKLAFHLIEKYANIVVSGKENILKNEPIIFISNHLSNLDGLLLSKFFEEMDREVFFLAGTKLKSDPITNAILEIVPHIDIEPNKPDRKAIKNSVACLKNGKSVLIFPEGTRSRTGSLLKGRSGVYLIAKMAGVKIVPIAITGSEKCLPIEKNGKMSKESLVHADVQIQFGQSFVLSSLEGEDEPIDLIMKKIAEMLPVSYRGYYS